MDRRPPRDCAGLTLIIRRLVQIATAGTAAELLAITSLGCAGPPRAGRRPGGGGAAGVGPATPQLSKENHGWHCSADPGGVAGSAVVVAARRRHGGGVGGRHGGGGGTDAG